VQAPNQEPKELVPSSKAWTTLGTEGNLELPAEKQVLDDEALTADGGDEGGQEEPDDFEHRGRIADPRSRRDRGTVFLPSYRPSLRALAGPVYDDARPLAQFTARR